MLSLYLLALVGTLTQSSASSSPPSSNRSCRAAPFTPDWPSAETWSSLNTTLSGRLLAPQLAASVCYSSRPEFDPSACRYIFQQWKTQEFHTEDPISVQVNQWTDWSCLPKDLNAEGTNEVPGPDETPTKVRMRGAGPGGNSTGPDSERECSGRGYPAYVVNATTAAHVQAAVDFAREKNVRLSVKNTGHDVPGRSNGPGALSIWTHNLNSMEYHPEGSFTLAGSGKTVKGDFMTAGSGCQAYDVQTMAKKYGRVFTSGGSKNVGLGGFVTGGGHSALSPHFGLGADNVLQMEVVTPDGKVLVVNEDQHPDLFWALRGGGGSTFGVVTSIVLRLHEDKPLDGVLLIAVTKPDSETAHELVPWGLSKTPYLMDSGITGYMFAAHSLKNSPMAIPESSGPKQAAGGFILTALYWDPQEDDAVEKAVQPMLKEAKERWGDQAQLFLHSQRYESFIDWFDDFTDRAPVGMSEYIVSRHFNRETLEDEETLRRITEPAMEPVWGLAAFMVAGKGVKEADVPGGANAVHPAWRDSSILGITWKPFPDYDREAGQEAIRQLDQGWQPIRDQMPNSGSYVNEGLKEERDWQATFWGANYERLLAMKRQVDPTDVFWCKPCVGYDRWVEVETEQGRQLCRAE